MQGNQRSFMASENIGSSLFVNLKKVSGVNQAQLEVSHADEQAYGVSHQGSREAPIPGVTPIAAAAGESCVVYGLGDPCEVLCGEASNAGDYLKPNADGKAIVCSEGDLYSAQAVSTTSAAAMPLSWQLGSIQFRLLMQPRVLSFLPLFPVESCECTTNTRRAA